VLDLVDQPLDRVLRRQRTDLGGGVERVPGRDGREPAGQLLDEGELAAGDAARGWGV
jgi:hypothetical protein